MSAFFYFHQSFYRNFFKAISIDFVRSDAASYMWSLIHEHIVHQGLPYDITGINGLSVTVSKAQNLFRSLQMVCKHNHESNYANDKINLTIRKILPLLTMQTLFFCLRNFNSNTQPEDHWFCITHLSAEDMLKSAVIEESLKILNLSDLDQ